MVWLGPIIAPLTPGTQIGPYEVLALLGAGGMGEVYRAKDSTLKREVALKVLPADVAKDRERLARFQREAEVLASLNHPHIAQIYGLEHVGDTFALVMELVEGEDLSQRIARGPIPIDEALAIARQIAEALEAAHDHGIIHRDLKPANIKVRADGTVKVLDFGLAKAVDPTAGSSATAMNSPTLSIRATQAGIILGTAAYMSPEQARGKPVDKRADIWAFGAVLFEMLTGQRAFKGEEMSDVLAAVLRQDMDWGALPAATPPSLQRLLIRCLDRDPRLRLRDIGEARVTLNRMISGAPDPSAVVAPARLDARPGTRVALPWVIAALALVGAGAVALRHARETPPPADAIQFTIAAPENTSFGGLPGGGTGVATQLAVSPDGRYVVFVARGQNEFQLWLRPIAGLESTPLRGTDGAAFPFWSPDSRFVAFFAAGKLHKVQITGGPPIPVCDATRGLGGTWNRDNIILFSTTPDSGGNVLMRVSGAGGVPVAASVLDTTTGETSHRWPHFLPDGRQFLFTVSTGTCCPAVKPSRIKIGALDSTESVTLFETESSAAYTAGHVLFSRAQTLMAQRFDPGARQLTGDPFPVADHVPNEGSRYASFSASENGVLLYARGNVGTTTRLTWFDRAGNITGTVGEPAAYETLALAPDDRRIAVSLAETSSANHAIWVIDSVRGAMSRLTFDAVNDTSPVWSPDGSRIAFQSLRMGESSMRQKVVSGAAMDEPLLIGQQLLPTSWSPDGRFIAYARNTSGSTDVWILPLTGDRKPFAFTQTVPAERHAAFAPDGKWIAYQSNGTGRIEIYVQPFPATQGTKYLVSTGGGEQPVWRADGKELFFLGAESKMMSATIDTTRQFEAGAPLALFSSGASTTPNTRQFAVSRDGKRFLVNARTERLPSTPITVVVNWLAAVQK